MLKNDTALDLSDPIMEKQNEISAYIIESYEPQQEKNAIMMLKLLALSEKDKSGGRMLLKEQLLDKR
ncbi:TPA: type II toxin-antitoxin system Phd/YefM family antitoxin [Serratia marcescens]|nr:type II toxin-antitoxin system Phd/YefM family antitoxin [Serratia marcescens]